MVVAVALVGHWLFSSAGSARVAATPPSSADPAARLVPAPRATWGGKKVSAASRSLDPTLRYDWLKASEITSTRAPGETSSKPKQKATPNPKRQPETKNRPPRPPDPLRP